MVINAIIDQSLTQNMILYLWSLFQLDFVTLRIGCYHKTFSARNYCGGHPSSGLFLESRYNSEGCRGPDNRWYRGDVSDTFSGWNVTTLGSFVGVGVIIGSVVVLAVVEVEGIGIVVGVIIGAVA